MAACRSQQSPRALSEVSITTNTFQVILQFFPFCEGLSLNCEFRDLRKTDTRNQLMWNLHGKLQQSAFSIQYLTFNVSNLITLVYCLLFCTFWYLCVNQSDKVLKQNPSATSFGKFWQVFWLRGGQWSEDLTKSCNFNNRQGKGKTIFMGE